MGANAPTSTPVQQLQKMFHNVEPNPPSIRTTKELIRFPELMRIQQNDNTDEGEHPPLTTQRSHRERECYGSPDKYNKLHFGLNQNMMRIEDDCSDDFTKFRSRSSSPLKGPFKMASFTQSLLAQTQSNSTQQHFKTIQLESDTESRIGESSPSKSNGSSAQIVNQFLQKQKQFERKRQQSLNRSRRLVESKLVYPYKPQVNQKSRKIVIAKRLKQVEDESSKKYMKTQGNEDVYSTPVNHLTQNAIADKENTIPMKSVQKKLFNVKNSIPVRHTKYSESRIKQATSAKMDTSHSKMRSSDKINRSYMYQKLYKQFTVSAERIQIQSKAGYVEFSEILKDLGMIGHEGGENFNDERKLVNEAWCLISIDDRTEKYSILSFVLAVFGIELANYWREIEDQPQPESLLSAGPKNIHQLVTDMTTSFHTDYYSDIVGDSRINNISRQLNRSRQKGISVLGTRTKDYPFLTFSQEQIQQITIFFKGMCHTKMNMTKGFSTIVQPIYKSKSKDRLRTNGSSQQRVSLKTQNLSHHHKQRIVDTASKLDLINPRRIPEFKSYDILHLEGLLKQSQKEQARREKIEKELESCSFRPRLSSAASNRNPSRQKKSVDQKRLNQMYERGRDKQRARENRVPEEDTRECVFGPDLSLTKGFRNSKESPHKTYARRGIVLQLKIDIGKGRVVNLSIRDKDDPRKVAKDFCKTHKLASKLQEKLIKIISKGIQRARAAVSGSQKQ